MQTTGVDDSKLHIQVLGKVASPNSMPHPTACKQLQATAPQSASQEPMLGTQHLTVGGSPQPGMQRACSSSQDPVHHVVHCISPPVACTLLQEMSFGLQDSEEEIEEPQGQRRCQFEGGTLIVCPTAVLNQWARELRTKVNPGQGEAGRAGLGPHVWDGLVWPYC